MTTGRRRHSRPDPLHRGKSHAQKRHTRTSASVKGAGKGTFFLVRTLRVRLGAAPAGYASSFALRRSQIPAAGRAIALLRCCILLLYQACEL